MGAVRTAAFSRVVSQFHAAAALPELLPAALHELALACGAAGATVHLSNGLQTFASVSSEGLTDMHRDFMTHWRAPELNSHRARGLDLIFRGWQNTLTEQDCFGADELKRDLFQQEFFARNGFFSFAGNILAKTPGSSLSISIIRRTEQGRFGRDEIEQIDALAAHLRSASALAMRIGISSSQHMAETLALGRQPIALLARDGRILHASAGFEALIGDGLVVRNGRLGADDRRADDQIATAVSAAIAADGELGKPPKPVILPRRNSVRPLIATVVPVVGHAHDVLRLVAAIVLLTDLEARPQGPALATLQQVFGLTGAEARLAQHIAIGETLPEIAVESGLSRETLRSQLKSVFNKTGTTRQAELAVLLTKLPMSW
jgi:DNA-binding CsgD family transcriptional regulator